MKTTRIKLRETEWTTENIDYLDDDWYFTLEHQGWNGGRIGKPDETKSIDFTEAKRLCIQNYCVEKLDEILAGQTGVWGE